MINKTIEHRDIVMVMNAKTAMEIKPPTLPEGYSFRFFESESDIEHWCRIETSVDEFDSYKNAYKHFNHEFIEHIEELKKRCIFILDKNELPIGTSMGWFSDCDIKSRLHWIAVCPEHQGKGLGKAVSQKAVTICTKHNPNESIWLSTQTGSYPAVMIYNRLGFYMTNKSIGYNGDYIKDFDRAIEVLGQVLTPEQVRNLYL